MEDPDRRTSLFTNVHRVELSDNANGTYFQILLARLNLEWEMVLLECNNRYVFSTLDNTNIFHSEFRRAGDIHQLVTIRITLQSSR